MLTKVRVHMGDPQTIRAEADADLLTVEHALDVHILPGLARVMEEYEQGAIPRSFLDAMAVVDQVRAMARQAHTVAHHRADRMPGGAR